MIIGGKMAKAIITAAVILIASAMAIGPSNCEDKFAEEDLRVFDGTVTAVDVSGSSLTVKGATEITFPISLDTQLTSDIYDIKLSDVDIGDYVTVQYYRRGSESRVPSKVIKVTVEYKGKKE